MGITQTLEVPGYQVVEFLGSGACSTIWRIKDCHTGEVRALKRVVKRTNSDTRFIEQAMNEYEVASQLEHPVLRRMIEARKIKRWLKVKEIHLVMEFCDGQTVQDNRPTEIIEVLRIFEQVAFGLAYMNSQGYVHADMKPNKILVSPHGQIKIIDFGQSCRVGTIKTRIQGTPDFIAPEQVHRRPLDARTDVFNFGATLYWTLAGKPIPTVLPKNGGSMLLADLAASPLAELNPDVSPPLNKLVCDCIDMHQSRRPSTMGEVASRLGMIAHKLNRDAARANGTGRGK
jgi:eukaryotic-like serine/threonine-protein kinase